jgi:hypothetical protein
MGRSGKFLPFRFIWLINVRVSFLSPAFAKGDNKGLLAAERRSCIQMAENA